MIGVRAVVFSALVHMTWCSCTKELTFPPGFKFGAASSAYQVEGAWNVSDKGENIWDRLTHTRPGVIADGSNGDVACDSYSQWRRDVDMASELGLNFYRFSISWSRLMPTGVPNYISEIAKDYYDDLIDRLLAKGIEPAITMHHFDIPQRLQDLGGWTNPLVSDWFADYARVLYSLYADRVKIWFTINEPINLCDYSYNTGLMAPGIKDPQQAAYLCNKYVLIAHAKAWRIYDEEYKSKYHGKMSIVNNFSWYEGHDQDLVDLTLEYNIGLFAHPIYSKEGGWPPAIEYAIAKKSMEEGYPYSKLPPFTPEEIKLVRGTYDLLAFNHYLANTVRKAFPGEKIGPWPSEGAPDLDVVLGDNPHWDVLGLSVVYPPGIRYIMNWLVEHYGHIDILISENGLSTGVRTLQDFDRIEYIKEYLYQILLAMKEGVNVLGYTVWALMDNFEWDNGYTEKFGLYDVDFSNAERTRTPRASAGYYSDVIRTHSLCASDQNM